MKTEIKAAENLYTYKPKIIRTFRKSKVLHLQTLISHKTNNIQIKPSLKAELTFFFPHVSRAQHFALTRTRTRVVRLRAQCTIGGPSSSCDMIILRNNSHGRIIRVCMGIFTTALRNKQNTSNSQKKNTSPYFHSVSFVI